MSGFLGVPAFKGFGGLSKFLGLGSRGLGPFSNVEIDMCFP